MNDEEDKHVAGVADFFKSWPASDVTAWPGSSCAELGKEDHEGGCWTGGTPDPKPTKPSPKLHQLIASVVETWSADAFPFVGPVPNRPGHYIAAGFAGHGMPRILLSAAHITPLVLESLGVDYRAPLLVASYPPLPRPFHATPERIERLQDTNTAAMVACCKQRCAASAEKPFCNIARTMMAR